LQSVHGYLLIIVSALYSITYCLHLWNWAKYGSVRVPVIPVQF
jgi:hypothetical protein